MPTERNPIPPPLSKKVITLVTKLCFRKDDKKLEKVDGIFLFSSSVEIKKHANIIKLLIKKGFSERIFISGGLPPLELAKDLKLKKRKIESEMILNKIKPEKFPNVKFFSEKISSNTHENVTEMLKEKEFKKCKSLIFVFKSHASGRGYLTLRKFFPKEKILQKSINTKYKRAPKAITRNNWYTFPFGRRRVWGEFLRIKKYGERGDIEYNSVKDIVKEIVKLTKI